MSHQHRARTDNRVRAAIAVSLVAITAGCSERYSPSEIDEMSRSLANVMIAVQHGADSTARTRLADSVARAHGYSDWAELRNDVADVGTEPDRLRALLDSTQRRIEKQTQMQ